MCRRTDIHAITMTCSSYFVFRGRPPALVASLSGIDRVSEAALSELAPQLSHNLEKKKIKFLTRSIICNTVT